MPAPSEFNLAFERLKGDLEKVGAEIQQDNAETENGSEEIIERYVVASYRGSSVYIAGEVEDDYFNIVYPLNIANIVAQDLSGDEVKGILDAFESQVESPDDPSDEEMYQQARQAAETLLKQMDEDEKGSYKYRISTEIADSDVGVFLESFEEDPAIHRIEIDKRLYPYLNDYSIREVGDALQAVSSIGAIASRTAARELLLYSPERDEEVEQYQLTIRT